jgi:hypothetical protein
MVRDLYLSDIAFPRVEIWLRGVAIAAGPVGAFRLSCGSIRG